MKKLLLLLFVSFFAFFYGCSNDSGGSSTTDPFGGGGTNNPGGNTGNVSFTVALVHDEQQNIYFEMKPSTNVVVTHMSIVCQALGVNQELTEADISNQVFSSTAPMYVGPVNVNLQQGQQWAFTIQGKVGSTTGQAFTATTNFTVQ